MSDPTRLYTDRRRAEAFGAVAADYDRYRPRYPESLITRIVDRPGLRVLDVGAGTGISSVQLADAGADVLAVEPDLRMAEVCAGKGIPVEHGHFEQWDPADRRFDVVVFGQSFHWVQPDAALPKVAAILVAGGRLVLMWNRIVTPVDPSTAVDDDAEAAVVALIEGHGFAVERVEADEPVHYRTDDWLAMVATQSHHLAMDSAQRAEAEAALRERIGPDGVSARNRALALFCTRPVAD